MVDHIETESQLHDLTCLYEITKELASSFVLSDCLEKAMALLSEYKNMENGTVTIVNPLTGKLEIEVAHGLTAEGRRRGKYKIGEGITGRVVASGEPIIVPHISEEPLFLNRTRSRGDIADRDRSFLCVPIKDGKQVIGALSVDRMYTDGFGRQANDDLQFLTVFGLGFNRKIQGSKFSRQNCAGQVAVSKPQHHTGFGRLLHLHPRAVMTSPFMLARIGGEVQKGEATAEC